jgi:hypothetical protein
LGNADRWAAPLLVELLSDVTLEKNPGNGVSNVFQFDPWIGGWPGSHPAHSALRECLSNAGLPGRVLNLATGKRPDAVQVEIKRAQDWWREHGSAFLQGKKVPNPELTMVFWSS